MDRRALLLGALAALAAARSAWAQQAPAPQAPAQPAPAQPGAAPQAPKFKPEELEQLLAPIALYPDSLLSQVLMASTYPLEVVEASRWCKANPAQKGDAAVAAVQEKTWDVSVKSLVAFPPVLAEMDTRLEWTQKLGDAMLAQQADVAEAIQRLRGRASDTGNLVSGAEQKVTTSGSGNDRVIVIEPAGQQIVHVPTYSAAWAYGPWPYPTYPPYTWGAPLARGFLWGAGFIAAGALFGGWAWNRGGSSYVNVNASRAVNIDRNYNRGQAGGDGRWNHAAHHRGGVPYRDQATRDRYGQNRPGADQRNAYRGHTPSQGPSNVRPQQPGQRPGGQQPGQRPGGQQPGQRPAQQPGQRPGGQQPQQRPVQRPQNNNALSGVNRGGQQINRESARGNAQHNRSMGHSRGGGGGGQRGGGGGGGGGGQRGGGGGGGGGGRGGGGGGGGRGGGGGGGGRR